MGRKLSDLADVCRRTGYPVVEVDGWQTRGRGGTGGNSTGGYQAGKPDHVIVHHTASPASSDGWPDVDYCTFADSDAPLCNLYLARDGTVYVCAAMATNCNGSGHDPCGHVADDSMNAAAIAIEAGNNGTGEHWPDPQLDSYVALCAELDAAYGIPTGRIHSHAEYAPGRKSDPAGPDRYAAGATPWNMDAFRGDVGGSDTTNGGGDFLMALTDDQQAELYNRVMGSTPGPYTDTQRGSGPAGDGHRRYGLDDQDGAYFADLLERIARKLGA